MVGSILVMKRVAAVTHTLDPATLRRLRRIAFRERLSKSSVIEGALDLLFEIPSDKEIGALLRERGARLRRAVR